MKISKWIRGRRVALREIINKYMLKTKPAQMVLSYERPGVRLQFLNDAKNIAIEFERKNRNEKWVPSATRSVEAKKYL